MGWIRFIFFIVLDTLLALLIAFGPPFGLYYSLHPTNFFERLIGIAVCGVLFCIMAVAAFMFWAFFITETTGM